MSRIIRPEPLSAVAFAPFGDVISPETAKENRHINYGNTTRFHDLASLDLTAGNGQPLVSIFRSQPQELPFQIKIMERHPLSSQAFYPLSDAPYLVVVSPKGEFEAAGIRVFLAGPGQGVNYHAGTWHHFSLALEKESDFLVIDRGADDENCDEVELEEDIVIAM